MVDCYNLMVDYYGKSQVEAVESAQQEAAAEVNQPSRKPLSHWNFLLCFLRGGLSAVSILFWWIVNMNCWLICAAWCLYGKQSSASFLFFLYFISPRMLSDAAWTWYPDHNTLRIVWLSAPVLTYVPVDVWHWRMRRPIRLMHAGCVASQWLIDALGIVVLVAMGRYGRS